MINGSSPSLRVIGKLSLRFDCDVEGDVLCAPSDQREFELQRRVRCILQGARLLATRGVMHTTDAPKAAPQGTAVYALRARATDGAGAGHCGAAIDIAVGRSGAVDRVGAGLGVAAEHVADRSTAACDGAATGLQPRAQNPASDRGAAIESARARRKSGASDLAIRVRRTGDPTHAIERPRAVPDT